MGWPFGQGFSIITFAMAIRFPAVCDVVAVEGEVLLALYFFFDASGLASTGVELVEGVSDNSLVSFAPNTKLPLKIGSVVGNGGQGITPRVRFPVVPVVLAFGSEFFDILNS
jgi:hypothetical protein